MTPAMKRKELTEEQDRVFKFLSKTIIDKNLEDAREILNTLFELRLSQDKHENRIFDDFSWMEDDEWLAVRSKVEERFSILLK